MTLGSRVAVLQHGLLQQVASPQELADAAAQDVTSLATLVARMDPQTALSEGQIAKVQVETTRLHFFDPGNGLAIRD